MEAHSEARYRALFETTLDGIMIVDEEGRYVEVNDSLCQLLKAPRERLIGAHFSEFIPAQLVESASTDFRELKDLGSFTGEFPMQALDGSIVELEWSSRAHFVPGLHLCVARDISGRKEVERELHRKQQELTDFIENATMGLHWVGPDGTILWANRAELELLGYSREEYIGHHIAEFHVDPPVIQEILHRLTAREEIHSYEARLRCKDGSIRNVLISSNVLWEEGRFVHTRCFTRDITERKQAEGALRESEERFRTLTTYAPTGIFLTDSQGHCLFVNERWCELAGMSSDQARGEGWVEALHPEDRERVFDEWYTAAQAGREFASEYRFQAPDGKVSWLRGSAVALRGPAGEVVQYLGTVTDITQRKRAEGRLTCEHAITRVLAEARTLGEAAPRILESVCQCVEAVAGVLWEVDAEDERLRCTAVWVHSSSPELEGFESASRSMSFAPGVGLPGRVWRERQTATITDLGADANFPRLHLAQAAGLQSGLAFPLATGEEVFGVIEFFIERTLEPDDDFLQMITAIGQDVGQFIRRRRAEHALAAERERLQVTFASIGDAVIVTDAAGRPTFLNPVAEELTGWTQTVARGKTLDEVFRIVNEETRHPVESPVERVLREGCIVGLANHTLLIARDGTERAIDDSAAPIPDEAGSTSGVVLVFRDVTERRRAEEARSRLAAIVESSDMAIFSKDMEGIVTSWNRAAEQLYGYSEAEMVGGPITRIIPPDRADEFPALMERLRRGEAIAQYETERVRKDGRRLDVVVNLSPTRNRSGQIDGAAVIARDITAAKQAEQERRESEQRLRLALQAGRMGTWEWNLRSGQIRWSSDLEAIHGLAPGSFGGTFEAYLADVHPDDRELVTAALRGTLEGETDHHIEYRLLWADGSIHWVEGRGRLFQDASGEPQRMIGVCTDITERKLAEQALEEAGRRKDDFLAMLAHELRNPLAPIRNALHLLRLQPGDVAAVDRWRDMMERQVGHMTRLVDDLLDVSRINRGKIDLQRERLDLRRLLQLNADDHRAALEEEGLSLSLDLPETPVWVMGDATRLTQVLDNLLENAQKFTERGGEVRIGLTVSAAEREATIAVADTGIGIEAEMLPRLFDVFSQADRSLDRSRGGLGLGLALVKGLMELHGGSVEARSAGTGRGAEFLLRLPLEPGPLLLSERREAVTAPSGGLRILVVEDNRDTANSLRELLETYGHQVRAAYSGPEGLKVAEEVQPDVILCDIGLPGMDGYEVAQNLRRAARFAGTRLIALTGYGQETDKQRSQQAGFDAHLTKPVDPNELLNRLETR